MTAKAKTLNSGTQVQREISRGRWMPMFAEHVDNPPARHGHAKAKKHKARIMDEIAFQSRKRNRKG